MHAREALPACNCNCNGSGHTASPVLIITQQLPACRVPAVALPPPRCRCLLQLLRQAVRLALQDLQRPAVGGWLVGSLGKGVRAQRQPVSNCCWGCSKARYIAHRHDAACAATWGVQETHTSLAKPLTPPPSPLSSHARASERAAAGQLSPPPQKTHTHAHARASAHTALPAATQCNPADPVRLHDCRFQGLGLGFTNQLTN